MKLESFQHVGSVFQLSYRSLQNAVGRSNITMEIQKVIEYLHQQRAMIDETIVCLERLSEGSPLPSLVAPAKRRGRKFMDADDRQKVSERMKQYWASRRSPDDHRLNGAA